MTTICDGHDEASSSEPPKPHTARAFISSISEINHQRRRRRHTTPTPPSPPPPRSDGCAHTSPINRLAPESRASAVPHLILFFIPTKWTNGRRDLTPVSRTHPSRTAQIDFTPWLPSARPPSPIKLTGPTILTAQQTRSPPPPPPPPLGNLLRATTTYEK